MSVFTNQNPPISLGDDSEKLSKLRESGNATTVATNNAHTAAIEALDTTSETYATMITTSLLPKPMIEGLLVDERIKQSREKKSKPEVEIATTMLLKLNQTHTLPGAVQDFLKEYIQACLEKNIQELRNNLKNYKEFKQKYDSEKFLQQKLPGLEIPELSTEWIQELARAIIQMATLDTKHIDSIKTNWQEVFAQAKDLHDRWVAGINPEKALEINSPVYDLATKDDYSPLRSQLFLGNSY